MDEVLVAPCGINCNVCSGYLAMKNDVKSQGVKAIYCVGSPAVTSVQLVFS